MALPRLSLLEREACGDEARGQTPVVPPGDLPTGSGQWLRPALSYDTTQERRAGGGRGPALPVKFSLL